MADISSHAQGRKRTILVFGKDGQVGRSLRNCFENVTASVIFLGRQDLDLSDLSGLIQVLNQYQPQVIVNASAYTAVDQAQQERELAFAVNRDAVAVMANYMAQVSDGVLVHYSTDYVYSGERSVPYNESDDTGPLSVYGQSKLAGDEAIVQAYASSNNGSRYFILRTSWVYGDGSNFIRTMLRLAAEKEHLQVVADQYGVPTSSDWLAFVAKQLIFSRVCSGIYHAVPDGRTSWHGLAVFVLRLAQDLGYKMAIDVNNILPIESSQYPVAAPRPKNSCLNNQRLKQALSEIPVNDPFPSWQEQVMSYVVYQVHDVSNH